MGGEVGSSGSNQAAAPQCHSGKPHEADVAYALDHSRRNMDPGDSALADVLRNPCLTTAEKDAVIRTLIKEGRYSQVAFFGHVQLRAGTDADRHDLNDDLQVIGNALQGAYERGQIGERELLQIADTFGEHGGNVQQFDGAQQFLAILQRSTGSKSAAELLATLLWQRNGSGGADRAAATVCYLSDKGFTARHLGDAKARAEAAKALSSFVEPASRGVQRIIAGGGNPQATLDIAAQMERVGNGAGAELIRKAVVAGVQQFKSAIAADVNKLAKHSAELAFLVDNCRGAMTKEQLDAAVKDYRSHQDPAWQQQEKKLREQIGSDGKLLIEQLTALVQQRLPGVDSTLQTLLGDRSIQAAISTALQLQPELVDRQHVDGVIGVFTSAQLGDLGKSYLHEMASSYLREHVLEQLGDVNLQDLRSVERAKKLLEGMRGEQLATMLGVTPDKLDAAVDALLDAWYESGTSAGQAQRAMEKFERNLRKDPRLLSAFDATTVRGAMIRTVGVALAGVALVNSYKSAADQPTLQNEMRLLLDSAGFVHKTAETLVGLGWISKESALGRFAEWKAFTRATAGDLIAGAAAMLDVISAADSFRNGEYGVGIASLVGAGGGVLSMLPSMGLGGAWMGPVGIALTAASVLGKEVITAYTETHKYDQALEFFLKAGGFSAAVAAELACLGKDGGSTEVAFLAKYAELKGMTPVELQSWVNSLSTGQRRQLAGLLVRTTIDCGGDPARLTAADYKGSADQTRVIFVPRGSDPNDPMPKRVPLMTTLEAFEAELYGDHRQHAAGGKVPRP